MIGRVLQEVRDLSRLWWSLLIINNLSPSKNGCLCKIADDVHQGDQYVVLNVRLPREINEQQRRLLESFREEEQQRKKKAA